jgi:2-hydroxy-6-oxonona-2,4-dienedioate hydrolase
MAAIKRPGSGFAEVNGARLSYEVDGSGDPLVMVHAGVADRRMWDDQWSVLAERYTVVRYDLRGFGQSASVEGAFSHHEDLYGLLEFLGITGAVLIGCSRGGATCIDMTLEHPDRTRALILVGAGVGGIQLSAEPPKQWQEVASSFEAGDLQRTSELEVQIWVDGPRRTPDQVDPQIRSLVREMNLIALQNEKLGLGSEQALDPPAFSRLDELRIPTLVIVGDEDQPAVVQTADLLEQRIAGARKEVMHGTAHLPNMEQPEHFNRLVLDFLSSL